LQFQPGDNSISRREFPGTAEEGASTSNLSSGSEPSDPAADVFGWTNGNNNFSALIESSNHYLEFLSQPVLPKSGR